MADDKLLEAFAKMAVKAADGEDRPLRNSDFLITINPNVYPASRAAAREIRDKLRGELDDMFSSHEKLQKLIQVIDEGGEYSGDFIDSIDVQYSVERGTHPKGRRVHAHVILKVAHWTRVRVDIPHIREKIKTGFGVNPHVNVRLMKRALAAENYIKKAPELSSDSE